MAEEYRTIMYSIGVKGEVMVHRFPWNANEKVGMQKLQKLEARGFTFEDPRKTKTGMPEVIVTRVVNSGKPEIGEGAEVEAPQEVKEEEKPPLYVSDKPPKKVRKKRKG